MAAGRLIGLLWAGWILVAGAMAGCGDHPPAAVSPSDSLAVVIAGRTFYLELALDNAARARGLSNRAGIAEDGGMIFVFPDVQRRRFWMRQCLTPIDLIYLDPAGRIVSMHEMQVEPPDRPQEQLRTYDSQWPAQFAVELAGGSMRQLSLQIGQRIELPLETLKGRAQ